MIGLWSRAIYSNGWMRTMMPSWSTYQIVTGSLELSIHVRRLCEIGSGRTYSVQRLALGLKRTMRPAYISPAQISPKRGRRCSNGISAFGPGAQMMPALTGLRAFIGTRIDWEDR